MTPTSYGGTSRPPHHHQHSSRERDPEAAIDGTIRDGDDEDGDADGDSGRHGRRSEDSPLLGKAIRDPRRWIFKRSNTSASGGASAGGSKFSITSSLFSSGSGKGRKNKKNRKQVQSSRASIRGSVANIMNTILGTGMLSMPRAVASGGLIPGAFTIVFCGITAGLGLYFLTRCAAKAKHRQASFFALSQMTFPAVSKFFDAAIALKCFGVSVSYLIIFGGLMPDVVSSFTPEGQDPPEALLDRRLWITIAMGVLIPLGFLRKLDSLRHTSYIALFSVVYLMIVIIVQFFHPPSPTTQSSFFSSHSSPNSPTHVLGEGGFNSSGVASGGETGVVATGGYDGIKGDVKAWDLKTSFISTLPVYIFAYTCAQNLFSVYNELANNTQKRMNVVIFTAIGTAIAMYLVVGLLGYATFGSTVPSNIMTAYPSSSTFVSICRVFIVVLVLFSYPMQLHPCRASLDKVLRAPAPPNAYMASDRHSDYSDSSDLDEEDEEAYDDDDDEQHPPGTVPPIVTAGEGEDENDPLTNTSTKPPRRSRRDSVDQGDHGGIGDEIGVMKFVIMTSFILLLSFLIALNVERLDLVLGFVGSTGSTTISFILPSAFFIGLFRRRGGHQSTPSIPPTTTAGAGDSSAFSSSTTNTDRKPSSVSSSSSSKRNKDRRRDRILLVVAWVLLIYGIVAFVACLGLNVVEAIREARGK